MKMTICRICGSKNDGPCPICEGIPKCYLCGQIADPDGFIADAPAVTIYGVVLCKKCWDKQAVRFGNYCIFQSIIGADDALQKFREGINNLHNQSGTATKKLIANFRKQRTRFMNRLKKGQKPLVKRPQFTKQEIRDIIKDSTPENKKFFTKAMKLKK